VADESLFTSQTPGGFAFDATGISLGMTVVFAVAGSVKGARFYAHTSLSGGTYTAGFYSVDTADSGSNDPGSGTGTQLATATFGTMTAGAWNTVTFGSPVSVSANTPYRVVGYSSVGRYGSTSNLFSSAITNGNITGVANNTSAGGLNIRNGTYNYATNISYPNDHFSGEGYFVDVIFEASATAAELVIPRRPARGLVMR
jgi:Domain of unknown function (DUF4082)